MALTGELSDLSLAELIEFFCNQRKTGRLKVVYTSGPGYFYLQAGSVVHARIGVLRGIEAVYYALTLPNASFTFSPAFEAPEHTINQPWTSVVLEGLRRMDEGITPRTPFPEQKQLPEDESKVALEAVSADSVEDHIAEDEPAVKHGATDFPSDPTVEVRSFVPEFATVDKRRANKPWTLGAVVGAVVLIVAVIGVPWGWYAHNKAARLANEAKSLATDNAQTIVPPVVSNEPSNGMANEVSNEAANTSPAPSQSEQPSTNSEADLAAKRQREARAKELAKTREASTAAAATLTTLKDNPVAANPTAPKTESSPNAGSKRVTVQVTYDENGRVTQASGGDATALRIARQKRFPAGKAGSTTVTIPIN
jgi:cytoskeletal protein RodZ